MTHSASSRRFLRGRRVLVTGAAGSIGSELARQCWALGADVYFLDVDESRLHALVLELTGCGLLDLPQVVLADVRDRARIDRLFAEIRPEVVFHAAAHKHLPLLERYPSEGVKTNVAGTMHVLDAAIRHGAHHVVNVSTDKAAAPTSVLGATKRLAESVVIARGGTPTRLASVRFGNVLASRGSLIDTLRHQLLNGLPVSITDPDVERYFMTIPEAVQLVIEAGALAGDGETYVLDMGEPVRIVDIVERLAAFYGVDAPEIDFVGLRPGEKLSEDLFGLDETIAPTSNPRIRMAPATRPGRGFDEALARLFEAAAAADDERVARMLPGMTSGLVRAAA